MNYLLIEEKAYNTIVERLHALSKQAAETARRLLPPQANE